MSSEVVSSSRQTNRCVCLFECECERVEKLISEWTSAEVLKTVQNRLLSCTDPMEIFARFACVLFYREILDHVDVKTTDDNLKKANVAFRFVSSISKANVNCSTFYSTCWDKFHLICTRLEDMLSRISTRRHFPLQLFVEEVFNLCITEVKCTQVQSSSERVLEWSEGPEGGFVHGQTAGNFPFPSANPPRNEISSRPASCWDYIVEHTPTNSTQYGNEDFDVKPIVLLTQRPSSTFTPTEQTTSSNVEVDGSAARRAKRGRPVGSRNKRINSGPIVSRKIAVKKVRNAVNRLVKSGPNNGNNADRSGWYKCPLDGCQHSFKHEFLLKAHMNQARHRMKATTICGDCGYIANSYGHIRSHSSAHDMKNPIQCDLCDYRFPNALTKANHNHMYHKSMKDDSSAPSTSKRGRTATRAAARGPRAKSSDVRRPNEFGSDGGRKRTVSTRYLGDDRTCDN